MTEAPARPRSRSARKQDGDGWYRISNSADGPAQILIYSEVGWFGVTAQDFISDLAAINGPVEIRLNSPGGDVFEAFAIYQALASRPNVTTVVDSLAASAASVIAMAGEQRLMAAASQMMIHDAWALSDGNADDLRHMAGRLDTVSGQIAGIYATTAGGNAGFWRDQMRAETWYTPEQALEAGLITAILPAGRGAAPAPVLEPAAASAGDPGIRAAASSQHEPFDGSHDHPHPANGSQGGDEMHSHPHSHDGDAAHGHTHGGDGSQDSATGALCAHFGWTQDQAEALSEEGRASLLATLYEHGVLAADVDTSAWDGNAAMSGCSSASDYRAICAGEKTTGDSDERQHWALPHHKSPGAAPNAAGVRAAESRIGQTDDLKNKQAAQAHLDAHMKVISPGSSDSATPAVAAQEPPAVPAPAPVPAASTSVPAATASGRTGPHPGSPAAPRKETTVTTMSIEDRAARRGEIEARLTAIGTEHGDAVLGEETQAEWDTLSAELDEHQGVLASHEQAVTARRERVAAIAARQEGERVTGAGYTGEDSAADAGDPNGLPVPPAYRGPQNRAAGSPGLVRGRTDVSIYDMDDLRKRSRSAEEMTALCRDNALRAVERAVFPGSASREDAQSTVERLLARVPDENGILAKRILATGNPLYMQAWGKAVARLSTGGLSQDEIRALSVGTGSDGGFAVPFELDPTVLLVSDGAICPIRELSRVVQITGKEYDLVTSQGITVSRSAEASPVPENTPVLAQPTIKAERVTGFIPFSVEIDQDWNAMQSEMMTLLADAKDIEECVAFTNGSGTAPDASGIITTLDSSSHVTGTGGAGALDADDLDALENDAAPRFRPRAAWMASKTTFNAYRKLLAQQASSAGDDWARPSAGQPMTLRGYPVHENSEMAATHATGDKVLLFGDFSRGAICVDRLGMNVELVPHLVDQATARPTAERGILAIWRNNFMPLVPNAFRLLVVG